MATKTLQSISSTAWNLAAEQHGVVSREQLIGIGLTPMAIRHRLDKGRIHPVRRGVYAVGRPEITRHGRWMAAVLACGIEAVLSHESAAALWQLRDSELTTEVSVPPRVCRRGPELTVHRRILLEDEKTHRAGIPVASIEVTISDLALRLPVGELERVIDSADRRDLTNPETLSRSLPAAPARPGSGVLRAALERRSFRLTRSELERLFIPLARAAGVGTPATQQIVNGFEVDFYWPSLGLVVETDGLRYHRTPAQQARNRVRDQAHASAGLVPLRFTHGQVRYEPGYVRHVLGKVARRLQANRLKH